MNKNINLKLTLKKDTNRYFIGVSLSQDSKVIFNSDNIPDLEIEVQLFLTDDEPPKVSSYSIGYTEDILKTSIDRLNNEFNLNLTLEEFINSIETEFESRKLYEDILNS